MCACVFLSSILGAKEHSAETLSFRDWPLERPVDFLAIFYLNRFLRTLAVHTLSGSSIDPDLGLFRALVCVCVCVSPWDCLVDARSVRLCNFKSFLCLRKQPSLRSTLTLIDLARHQLCPP